MKTLLGRTILSTDAVLIFLAMDYYVLFLYYATRLRKPTTINCFLLQIIHQTKSLKNLTTVKNVHTIDLEERRTSRLISTWTSIALHTSKLFVVNVDL
jgi:hypothetical protein